MSVYSKQLLSGSTNGRGVLVAATATAGTLIHTATAADLDEVWLYAVNTSGSDVVLTVEYGGVTVGDQIVMNVPTSSGLVTVVPGLLLSGTLVVRAFAATTNVINVIGFVNRIA